MIRGEILSIGNELLQGRMDDTNATYLSQRLTERGVRVLWRTTVGDGLDHIAEALERAAGRADVVFATGGLGPTVDDMTAQAVADFLGLPLARDQVVDDRVRMFHRNLGIDCPDNALDQALVPEGAEVFLNPAGTAPGIGVRKNDCSLVFFPGVPREMKALLPPVLEWALGNAGAAAAATRTLRLFGVGESTVQNLLPRDIITSENPSFSFLPADYQLHLRLTARGDTRDACLAMLEEPIARLYEAVGEYIYGEDDTTLEQALFQKLERAGLTFALAESVTGGEAATRFVSVPGASRVFRGGIVAYSEAAKMELLGVSEQTLSEHGPVSEAVTLEMARGAMLRMDADAGLATTGNAGPDAQGKAPVGQVYAAVVFRDPAREEKFVARRSLRNRNDLRALAALFTLDLLAKSI